MQITRKDIANYYLLEKMIDKSEKKLQEYIEKKPSDFAGKVYGSNDEFPYQPVGFVVHGMTGSEMQESKAWDAECERMEKIISNDIDRMNRIKSAIDELIAGISDIQDKAILQYTKERKSQQWIADKVGLDQSVVSRRLKKYIKS